jgi:hypothetical protein
MSCIYKYDNYLIAGSPAFKMETAKMNSMEGNADGVGVHSLPEQFKTSGQVNE